MTTKNLVPKLKKAGQHWLNKFGLKDKELEIVFAPLAKDVGGTFELYYNNKKIPHVAYPTLHRDSFTKIKVIINTECATDLRAVLWVLLHEIIHVACPKYTYNNEWTDSKVEKIILAEKKKLRSSKV